MIEKYKNNFNLFKEEYVLVSKEPFQFLSCFISYYNYLTYKKEIKIPILFDASCSGIQHLSALTKDIKIAKLVNILNNEEPSDFYQYCIDKIVEIIKELPNELNGLASNNFKDKLLKKMFTLLVYILRHYLKQVCFTFYKL